MKPKDIFCLVARIAVGGVLFYAGFIKAAGPTAEFAAAIASYKILPSLLITPLAFALPYIEMWVGAFVFAGLYTRWAALAAGTLSATFFIVLLTTMARGIDLATCGCFGADALSPKYTIILDAVLLGLALGLFRFSRSYPRWSLDQTLSS